MVHYGMVYYSMVFLGFPVWCPESIHFMAPEQGVGVATADPCKNPKKTLCVPSMAPGSESLF